MSEFNPLVQRVDALLKRHQQQAGQAAPAVVPAEQETADLALPDIPAGDPFSALPSAADTEPHEPPAGESIPAYSPPPESAALDDDIPVLTEIVDPLAVTGTAPPGKALIGEIESAVLDKVLAELDRSLDRRLNRTIGEVVEQAMDGLRADLADHVRRVVHEAVAEALAKGDTYDGSRS